MAKDKRPSNDIPPLAPPTGPDDSFEPLPMPDDPAINPPVRDPSESSVPVDADGTIHAEYAPPKRSVRLNAADRALSEDAAKVHDQKSLIEEIPTQIVGGVRNAIVETGKLITGRNMSGFMMDNQDEERPTTFEYMLPEGPAPTRTAGQVTEGVSRFVTGMIGAGKFLRAGEAIQAAGKLATIGRGFVQGGIADVTVFGGTEERLSNLVEEHPSLSNPITEYLAAKPDDGEAEGRFKNFVEGAVTGGMVELLVASVRGIRSIRKIRAEKGEEAAQKAEASLADELEGLERSTTNPEAAQSFGKGSNPRPLPGNKLAPNIEPPEQSIKDYMVERLKEGGEFAPSSSRDFNLAKQATSDGAKQVIELMSDAIAPEMDALKGGVQSFEAIKRLADYAGEKPEALMARMSARASDAKRLASDAVATEQLALSLARQISEEARRVDNGIKDPTYLNSLQDTLAGVIGNLKAVKTSAARTTAAGRIIKRESLSPEQIKALVAAGGDLGQVSRILKPKSTGRKIFEAHNEAWLNALLSGPKTHLVNGTSNLLNTFANPLEKIAGGNVGEGMSQFMGIARGIKDSVAMAAKSWKLEESVLDASSLKVEGGRKAISSERFGLAPNSFMGSSIDWLGKAVRLPTRFLLASDELFKNLNYRAIVYSKATRDGVEQGLDGPALADFIESRFASAIDDSGKALDKDILQEARISTFTEDLAEGGIVSKVAKAANEHPALRLILPFVKTPTNIVKQVGWRTPGLNLAMKSYRDELRAGGGRAAAARGKFATGGMLWGAGILLASEGKLTGKGPTDPNERAVLMATGWRPYSVKVGDTYVDYSRLDPYGMALGLSADFVEARGHMSGASAEDIALAMGTALASNLTSKTYLRGMTEALDALSQPDKKIEHWLQSRMGSYVPSAVPQIAGLIGQGDTTMREVRTMMDAIYARTPGLSETLAPKRNYLGEPIKYPAGLGPDSISPIAMSKDLHDDVKAELARLSYGIKPPAEKINGGRIDLTQYKNTKGQDAHDRLLELRLTERKNGRTLKQALQAEIQSERYKRLPDGNEEYSSKKLARIQQIFGSFQEVTMKKVRKEFPTLDRDIKTDEHNTKSVKRTGVSGIQALLGN